MQKEVIDKLTSIYEEYGDVSGIPGMDAYHKQFAKPNMPTYWMRIPTHP